jgi:hypothetical protein
MIRQYGKLILLVSMMLISIACTKSTMTQSEEFRLQDSDLFRGDS